MLQDNDKINDQFQDQYQGNHTNPLHGGLGESPFDPYERASEIREEVSKVGSSLADYGVRYSRAIRSSGLYLLSCALSHSWRYSVRPALSCTVNRTNGDLSFVTPCF